MNEEQKSKRERKTADRDFIRALSPAQLAAIDELRLAAEAIPDDIRADILRMTPEQVKSHLSVGMKLKQARKQDKLVTLVSRYGFLLSFNIGAYFLLNIALTTDERFATFLIIPALVAAAIDIWVLVDALLFPQYDIYDIAKENPKEVGIAITKCLTAVVCVAILAAAGTVVFNSGTATRPAEPQQEQRADAARPAQPEAGRDVEQRQAQGEYSRSDKEE